MVGRSLAWRSVRHLGVWFLLAAAACLQAQPITQEQKDSVLKGIEDVVLNRAFVPGVDFTKWPEFIAKQKDAIAGATEIPAFTSAVNKALREFGLSHIRLQTPRAAEARTKTTNVGAGVQVRKDDAGLVVRGVVDKSPAKEVGLETGDTIVKVDGKAPTSPDILSGEKGKKVELEVKKASGETKQVTVEYREYSTARVETLTWVDAETAVLKIFTFSAGYNRSNIEKLMTDAAKAKYLVVDLRSNGGGASNNLNHLLSLLLPDGTETGVFVSRRLARKFEEEAKGDPKDPLAIAKWSDQKVKTRKRAVDPFAGKIAVLINRGSASASEIAAQTLREQAKAPLVGTKSAGAVLASVFYKLPEGFSIQYPVSDYVSAKGTRLEKNPLIPDAEVTGIKDGDKDPVVDKAVELLKKST
jgi:carboxyl-terminal processing protease